MLNQNVMGGRFTQFAVGIFIVFALFSCKQKTQKVGLGQQPKETREQRRMRIEEEAKAREVRVVKRLTYYLGRI